jgi:SAM-dependent methyltransferase
VTHANQEQRTAWNGESGLRWVAEADARDRVLAQVADALLDAADLQPGDRVLDLGCGCGATTLAAGAMVGPSGEALGIDLSEPMLIVAGRRAATAALDNVTFRVADAQTDTWTPLADVAISRFGTMFFDDPVAAFTNVARGLRLGGRLAIVTWQPLVANQWLTVPGAALLELGAIPGAGDGGPGMFAQSDPEIVSDVLRSSGFEAVDVGAATVPLRLGDDLDAATAYLAESGVGRAALATIPPDRHEAAITAVREAIAGHVDDDGVHLDGAIWITTAAARPT